MILIIIGIIAVVALWNKYEHFDMTPLANLVDASKNEKIEEMMDRNVCTIIHPQSGKDRSYINWYRIHDYGSL